MAHVGSGIPHEKRLGWSYILELYLSLYGSQFTSHSHSGPKHSTAFTVGLPPRTTFGNTERNKITPPKRMLLLALLQPSATRRVFDAP